MDVLSNIIIIFGLAILILYIFYQLHMPTIVGLLLTGILAGPRGLGVISAVDEVEMLAEIGVIALLFAIGVEFSLKELWRIRKAVIVGGFLQVIFTLLAVYFIAIRIGMSFNEALFIGMLFSLSSTAIVLKLLQEKDEIETPHGRIALAVLIFQDIMVVPMILITPLLAGEVYSESLILLMIKGIGIVLMVIISAEWVVPYLLYQIARTRSRELFILSIVFICFAVAWLTSSMGLSLALGAFLAGLIISESEYSHQALVNIIPFRDIFMSFFFVSIGMLLNIYFLFQYLWMILIIAFGALIMKSIIAGSAASLLGYPIRTSILAGIALSQIGEFSFILSGFGVEYDIISKNTYQFFLAISILIMAATPFIMDIAPIVADSVHRLPLIKKLYVYPETQKKVGLKDHLVIIGFGVNGRNVARAAQVAGIPYVVIEINPDTVKNEQAKGKLIYYGDAVHEAVLEHAGVRDARVMVIAISDPAATRRITATARRINPRLHIIARTRYLQEMKPLYDLGADEVIPEEFETSVEIFVRVLEKYVVPRDIIEKFTSEVRADGYEMFRSLSIDKSHDLKLDLPNVEISTLRVGETSPIIGKTLAELELRKRYGVTLLAIRRNSQILANPHGDIQLHANDIVVLLGTPDKIAEITGLFSGKI